MAEAKVLLQVQNLGKRFGGLTALRQINIGINQGELVGLIGPNGSGKTTLFNCITGFLHPESGSVRFNGDNITGLAPYKVVDKGIARTFQLVSPFAKLSLWQNVAVASARKGKDWKEKAWHKLELVGLASKGNQLAMNLSHGELQLLEIARALATEPRLLLLDEPFGGLTVEEIGRVHNLIRQLLAQGLTVFIIEHKLRELMKLVERVVVLHMGEMIAQGSPEQVVKDKKVITVYLGGS